MPADSAKAQRRVEHTTIYDYAGLADNTYHIASLQPRNLPGDLGLWVNTQQVLQYQLQIEPVPSHQRNRQDCFGNVLTEFEIRSPHRQLHITAVSELSILSAAPADPLLLAASEQWEQVAQSVSYQKDRPYRPESEFTFPSARIPKLEALHSLALLEFWPHRPVAQAAYALMQRIHRDFKYQSGSTGVDTPVEEVLRTRTGVCQDFAHILIGALRGIGLPARYVSGYMLTTPPPGKPKLIGADASHAWASVWVGEQGWMDLDPTNNKIPDERYVTVAIGRDYEDVPPLKGVLHGHGGHELSVAVTVD